MVFTMMRMFSLQYVIFFLPQIADSQLVSCYFKFDTNTGDCVNLIGSVEQSQCCFNSHYGFKNASGVCKSCHQASWSAWSSWGSCSVSCLKGVKQRRRRCDGIGECPDPDKLGTLQTTVCEDRDRCPEQGGWGEWGTWQPCSVTCRNGVSRRERACTNPPPKYGGSCDGQGQEIKTCETGVVCPTHGSWSDWGAWGSCSGTCRMDGATPPSKERKRTCTNPSPSSVPAGRPCEGRDTDTQQCDSLPMCPIDGAWGPWSALSDCSVTCGVGQQTRTRNCNNPAPKYGGKVCVGDNIAPEICFIPTHCPVDGEWEEWGDWDTCSKSTYKRPISCSSKTGSQTRRRTCSFTDFNGKPCVGSIVEHRNCYDITNSAVKACEKPGRLSEWTEWSLCRSRAGAPCGPGLKRRRDRMCVADVPEYVNTTYGRVYYSGKPKLNDCPKVKDFRDNLQSEDCVNVPPC